MKTYRVTIQFKRIKHDFSTEVQATDEQSAKWAALKWAQSNGYDAEVKSYKVRLV